MNHDDKIFAEALALPAAARAAFLDRACGDDSVLRARLETLLADYGEAERFLEDPPVDRPDALPGEKPGDVIGRYVLIRKLGEGGCGVVYLAEQTEPVRRPVALKIVKPGMDTREVIARFEAERHALALMDHPDIARVFDAGATGAGRPFFVMEYVDGVPITKFCDDHRLPLAARLELFARVCQAVQHAHQKGVIHRDLKPSNILVTLRDGVPVPMVIDFGIAKATQGRLGESTLTVLQQFIGTPAYMSPEQAEMSSLDIDTRSDIYSLGVLLYELLTGRTPFETGDLMQIGIDEMRRQIREVEPPRPSTCLQTLEAEKLAATAGHRHLAPPKLIHRIAGDLDWIVMRCLEKDRTRRYESAAGLAQDLRRHLNHEPVEARPSGALYRLQKLVRRHRLAFGATAAVAAALVLGLVTSTWQALRANRAEHTAQREAAIARAVNDFLVADLLRQADSTAQADSLEEPNPDLKVREALDRAAEKVGARFAQQPLTEAEVRAAIGESYVGIGLPAQAEPHLLRARQLREATLGAGHRDTLAAKAKLARCYFAGGKLPEAAALQAEILTEQTRALGEEHLALDETRNDLADTLEAQGKYAEAAALQVRTLEHRRRVLGPEHPDTFESMNNLGNTYYHQGKLAEAEALQAPSLAGRQRVLGPEHPATLNGMNNLAATHTHLGKYAEAAALHGQTLEILQRVLGPEHSQTVASMLNLAAAYFEMDRKPEAEALQVKALEITQRVLGPDHTLALTAMNNLSGTYRAQGKVAEAAAILERLRDTITRVLGPEHPNTLTTMLNLGGAYNNMGRSAEAAPLLELTREKMTRVLGPEHVLTLTSTDYLAVSYDRLGRLAESAALRTEALEIQKRVLGPAHPRTIAMMTNLALTYVAQGKPAEAAALRTEVLEAQKRVLGAEHAQRIATMAGLTVILLAEKQFAEAEPVLRELLAFREKTASDVWTTFNTRSGLGGALAGQQRFAEAEPLLVSGYEGMKQREALIPAAGKVRLKEALERLVQLYTDWDQPEKAADWQKKLDEQESATNSAAAPKP